MSSDATVRITQSSKRLHETIPSTVCRRPSGKVSRTEPAPSMISKPVKSVSLPMKKPEPKLRRAPLESSASILTVEAKALR